LHGFTSSVKWCLLRSTPHKQDIRYPDGVFGAVDLDFYRHGVIFVRDAVPGVIKKLDYEVIPAGFDHPVAARCVERIGAVDLLLACERAVAESPLKICITRLWVGDLPSALDKFLVGIQPAGAEGENEEQ
jgi:hypothetical protein